MNLFARRKYKNQKIEVAGIKFDSKAEAQMFLTLQEMQDQGKIKNLTLQEKFILLESLKLPNGKTQREVTYTADFCFFDIEQNRHRVLDCKGYATEVYRLKKKLFNKIYGGDGLYVEERI